ncbi:sodium/proline symporter [Fibrobacter sp. UWB16]|uniref:sodium/proline symporter PutP n=1 Tax=Fibrobacter sp. UWB16 TaxID=1945874 RepID=UPI000BCC3224|nr:sodium/proline symporter PutP [Fibrobacter sp. UWB16]SOD12551.1 sodium/proline symporter [Fibrobacter sp. UWB16]
MTIVVFILYLLMMLGIGAYFSRKANSLNAYYLGNRGMNKWVVAMSAQASDMSGWMLMGLPGAVFVSGFSEAWIGIGLVVGTYFNWKIVGRRLRKYSHFCGDSITLPDFFSNRFRDNKGIIRVIASIFILAFFLFYTVSGFVASAKLFSTIFGMDYTTGLILGAIVVVSYTFMGGFFAVCWTDFIQASMMLIAVLVIPLMIMSGSGGFASTMDAVNAQNPYLMSLFTNATTGKSIGLIALISSLSWGLGYFGMPHILVRFMSIKNAEEIKDSRRIAMTWVIICLAAVVMIALLGRYYVTAHGITVDDPERIFMILCQALCHPAIAAILMAAILAAIMSTADSQLLVSASAFSNDLYKHLFRKNASNKEVMWVSRGVVVVITLIAVIVAMQGAPSADGVKHGKSFLDVVMSLVSFAWGGFGATFGPIMLLALFWKRTTLPAAVAGMLVGGLTTFIWKFYLSGFSAEIFQIYELVPGFILSFVTIVVVSLLTKEPSAEIQLEFDRVESTRLSDIKL